MNVFRRGFDRRTSVVFTRLRGASLLVRAGALAALCGLVSSPALAQERVRFGFDAKSVQRARDLGMPVSYGSTWAGAWNQKWG